MNNEPSYTLRDVSKWAESEDVGLPNVQRGFVWKPYQIENLWDSLLRGYPVGAFVLSKKDQNDKTQNEQNSYYLLDGQQRATAICLGFGNETFRHSKDRIKIFIDLENPQIGDNRKYVFRVITKSHKWGYERNDNTHTLESKQIRYAMSELYEVEDHINEPLNKFFPFDAIMPIPLEFFVNSALKSATEQELLNDIYKWKHWAKVLKSWELKIEANKPTKKIQIELRTRDDYINRITSIYKDIVKMLDPIEGQKIPALYLDNAHISSDTTSVSELESEKQQEQEEENINKADEIENLFIRLNAGGTPLRGEELNYSILKAHIDKVFQDKIETSCKGLFNPARFITIAYRLFQNEKPSMIQDAISMRIKPKQFQKAIKADFDDKSPSEKGFKSFLKNMLNSKEYKSKTLLEYTIQILEYNKDSNPCGLPYPVVLKLSDDAPEIVFMLLYRLKIKKDRFAFDTIHNQMLGVISLFTWLGKGEKQRDHSKLLLNIWPCVISLELQQFWSASTVQRAMIDNVMPSIPTYSQISDALPRKRLFGDSDLMKKMIDKDRNMGLFIDRTFKNKDLILYKQREITSNWFNKEHYDLDDTNVPFDWDHISPNKYLYNRKNIPQAIKYWYNTNGNFRAWPYALNRMDQDGTPSEKLDPLNIKHYRFGREDDSYKKTKKFWQTHRNTKYIKSSDLAKSLLEWSCCDKEWLSCEVSDLKKGWKTVYNMINNRNLSIISEWYRNLKIENLIPTNADVDFSKIFCKGGWSFNTKKIRDLSDGFDDEYEYWFSKPINIGTAQIYIYFGHPEVSGDNKLYLLNEKVIEYGIFEKNDSNGFIVSKIKNIPEKMRNTYLTHEDHLIFGSFTLVSFDEHSYVKLFSSFKEWLEKFPNKEVNKLTKPFADSLVAKFKAKI
ncbi:MAG: DUF262 domain-containing protein [Chlorobium sp.]|nr:DUF262 domain-containing protein [Chlorobium sp.]